MRLETPLIELAREHVAIVNGRPGMRMRFAVYSIGLTPTVVWTAPSDEGTYVAVFLVLHPDRLLTNLLHLTPDEILAHFRPEEVCDAYLICMIEHDDKFHTMKTGFTERGQADLRLAIGEAEDTASAVN